MKSGFRCRGCRRSYHSMHALKWHMERNHASQNYKCSICEDTITGLIEYISHLKTHPDSKPKKNQSQKQIGFLCCCGKFRADRKSHLLQHIYWKHRESPHFPCPYCFVVYENFDVCREHCWAKYQKMIDYRVDKDLTMDVFEIPWSSMPSNSTLSTST